MDKVKDDVMAKWTPDKVEEVCGVPEAQVYKVAEMMAKNRPSTRRLVHGPDAAHDRQRDRARVVHPAARARQRRRVGRRRQHLPRPRQRAGRDRRRPESRFAARLLRPRRRLVEALGRRSGASTTSGSRSSTLAGDDGKARHDGVALDRRRDGEERADRPGPEPARDGVSGATRRTARRAARKWSRR